MSSGATEIMTAMTALAATVTMTAIAIGTATETEIGTVTAMPKGETTMAGGAGVIGAAMVMPMIVGIAVALQYMDRTIRVGTATAATVLLAITRDTVMAR